MRLEPSAKHSPYSPFACAGFAHEMFSRTLRNRAEYVRSVHFQDRASYFSYLQKPACCTLYATWRGFLLLAEMAEDKIQPDETSPHVGELLRGLERPSHHPTSKLEAPALGPIILGKHQISSTNSPMTTQMHTLFSFRPAHDMLVSHHQGLKT